MAEGKMIEMVLDQIELAKRVNSAVAEANSFREDCRKIGMLLNELSQNLVNLIQLISESAHPLYNRPIVAVVDEVSRNLNRVLTLVLKCNRWTLFRWIGIRNRTTKFRRAYTLLQSSIGDLKWLLCFYDYASGDRITTLPPIAIPDPVIPWVWSFISALKVGKLENRIDAAKDLASLAKYNDRNKGIIEKEGGIPPLLKLLREKWPKSQIAAADALCILSENKDIVRNIANENGIPSIGNLLRTSSIRVQIVAAKLVARMAENDLVARKAFADEHVIRPILKLLSLDLYPDEQSTYVCKQNQSIHSVFIKLKKQIRKQNSDESGLGKHSPKCKFANQCLNRYFKEAKIQKKEWEMETPDAKFELKMNCLEALLMLSRENVLICKNITESNGLISLAKLIEKEQGEIQYKCLMIVAEITAIAERDDDFRQSVIKNNSSGVKDLVDQLLRVSEDDKLQIPAIRSIGSLARIFSARDTRVIESLVQGLSNKRRIVAEEAIIALQKFVCTENYLRSDHSKSIINFKGVAALTRLIEKDSKEAGVLLRMVEDAAGIGIVKLDDGCSRAEIECARRRSKRRPLNCPFMGFKSFQQQIVILFRVGSDGELVISVHPIAHACYYDL